MFFSTPIKVSTPADNKLSRTSSVTKPVPPVSITTAKQTASSTTDSKATPPPSTTTAIPAASSTIAKVTATGKTPRYDPHTPLLIGTPVYSPGDATPDYGPKTIRNYNTGSNTPVPGPAYVPPSINTAAQLVLSRESYQPSANSELCTCNIAVQSRKYNTMSIWCGLHGARSSEGKLIPNKTCKMELVESQPNILGEGVFYKTLNQDGTTTFHQCVNNRIIRCKHCPPNSRVRPQELKKHSSAVPACFRVSEPILGAGVPTTLPPIPTKPSPPIKAGRPTTLSFAALEDEVNDDVSTFDTGSTISTQSSYKTAKSVVKRIDRPKKVRFVHKTILDGDINNGIIGVESDKARKANEEDREKVNDSIHRRITTTQIRRKFERPTFDEKMLIAEQVAAVTVFDSYNINNFRQMRHLILKKATPLGLHITVQDIAEIISHIVDEHMMMVALTEHWKSDEGLKQKLHHIHNLSEGLFKVSDKSLISRLREYCSSIAKTACFWEAPDLPNRLPGQAKDF
jgi:hypothetical protein